MTVNEMMARIRRLKRNKLISGDDLVVIAGSGDKTSTYAENVIWPHVKLTEEAKDVARKGTAGGFYFVAFEENGS